MLDRATNLTVVFLVALALVVLAVNVSDSWRSTRPWDQGWALRADNTPKYDAERLLKAMRGASEAGDYSAVSTLQEALEADYKPSGEVYVRLTRSEILEALAYFGLVLLLLIVPLSLNYVRHGKFWLWNRGT